MTDLERENLIYALRDKWMREFVAKVRGLTDDEYKKLVSAATKQGSTERCVRCGESWDSGPDADQRH